MAAIKRIAILSIFVAIYYALTGPGGRDLLSSLFGFMTGDYVQWWNRHGDGGAFLGSPIVLVVVVAVLAILALHIAGFGRFAASLIVAVFLVRFGLATLNYRQVETPGLTLALLTLTAVGFLIAEPFMKRRGLWVGRKEES